MKVTRTSTSANVVAKKQEKVRTLRDICRPAPKDFSIGATPRIPKDLTRYVRWPKNVRIQRQKALLQQRLKVPGQINQFNLPANKALTHRIFNFAKKYAPETKIEKRNRFLATRKANEEKAEVPAVRNTVKFGLDHVTSLIEAKKAKLVLIANDVDPIDLVMWMPALCHAKDVKYAIVRTKAQLGEIVGMKTCSCLAFTTINPEDELEFSKILDATNNAFNYKSIVHHYGGLAALHHKN